MTISVNIHEAKAQLSHLIDQMLAGETVQICRRNVPLAELRPMPKTQKKNRQIGFYKGKFTVPDDAFAPMPEEELALWYDAPLTSDPVKKS